MKAILVIDMPKECNECRLNIEGICGATEEPIYSIKCPLKPLPSTRNDDMEERGFNIGMFNYGWNECLREIEK